MNDLSFCKFHFPANINKIIWEITNQCNYSCEYCIFSSTGKKPRGELSFEKVTQTLLQLQSSGFNYIKFTGGEPFMREDFIEILKYAKSLDFNFDISTNASFITEEISLQLSLLDINFIHVSLDGYDLLSHEFVRGSKSFNKTINGLNNLLKYNKNIRLGCVIHSKNDDYLHIIVALANEMKVREIIFSLMIPIGRMDKKSISLTHKAPHELIKIIEDIESPYTQVKHNLQSDIQTISFSPINSSSLEENEHQCPGGTQFLFIDSIGIVSPCTWISESFPEFHLLSLHNHTLKDILNHNLFKHFKYEKSLLKGKCFAVSYKPYESNQGFNKIYSFATENISFINKLPLRNNSSFIEENQENKKENLTALVITGSGDQAISLTNKGFSKITCLDVNYLANYFTDLKIAALKSLSYQDFIKFFKNNENSFSYKDYKKLNHLLSPECEKFWTQQYIHYHHNGVAIRNSDLFNLKYDDWNQKVLNVPYLESEELYLIIQKNITTVTFEFVTSHFLDYEIKTNFDLILLSNIADYSHKIFNTDQLFNGDYIKCFKTFFVEKSLKHLNTNSILMFSYIYDFENKGTSSIRNKMNTSLIRKMYFKEFNYKEILIPSAIQNFEHDVICYINT